MATVRAPVHSGPVFKAEVMSSHSVEGPPDSGPEDLSFKEMDPSGRYGRVRNRRRDHLYYNHRFCVLWVVGTRVIAPWRHPRTRSVCR